MTLTREEKEAQVAILTEDFKAAESVTFAHYIGLNVADISALRQSLKNQGAAMRVAKKTLIKIAAKKAGLPEIDDSNIEGPVSCIFSFSDPLTGAQVAFKFAKDHEQVAIIGGMFDGKLLTREQALTMAQMPGRQELLAMFAGMLRSPLVTFASICSSPLSGFARGLKELATKGGASASATPAAVTEASKEEATDAPAQPSALSTPPAPSEPS